MVNYIKYKVIYTKRANNKMIKKAVLASFVLSGLFLQGCESTSENKMPKNSKEELSTIQEQKGFNKKELPVAMPEGAVAVVNGQPVMATSSMKNINEVITMEIVSQKVSSMEAQLNGSFSKDEINAINANLDQLKRNFLFNAYATKYSEGIEVSEDEIQKSYESVLKQVDLNRYKLKFSKFDVKEKAESAINGLKNNSKKHLKNLEEFNPSKTEDGWISLNQVPRMFASVVANMKEKGVFDSPLASNQGYFVVYIDDLKQVEKPSLDSLKPQITKELKRIALLKHLNEVRKESVIQIN